MKEVHKKLDEAVQSAYGMSKTQNPLEFLLELNEEVTALESAGEQVTGPGLPKIVSNIEEFVSEDCLKID